MSDQLLAEPPPPDQHSDDFSSELDSLPIPLMHSDFFSDLGLGLDIGDLDLTFDDEGNICIPSDVEDLLIPDGNHDSAEDQTDTISDQRSPESGGDFGHAGGSEVSGNDFSDKFLNYASSEFSQNPGDQGSEAARAVNCPSPESGGSVRDLSGGPVSSQGSGNLVADFDNCERDVSSHEMIDQKLKVEQLGKISVSKRKKEQSDTNSESRTTKYRRSLTETENFTAQSTLDGNREDEEEEKRRSRLMRNRESAQLSRQRKKHYVEELEDKVRAMHSTIADLNSKISFIVAENANLRHQLGSSGMCPPPPPGMYAHPSMVPMPYPWMPCAPYVVKPQGSQVPLVPIPRLKPQQPLPVSKAKKSDNKKGEGKVKKVASTSFLGLLFFIVLFGGLAPIVNVKYGGVRNEISGGLSYVGGDFNDHQGRLLTVNGHSNGSDHSRSNCERSHVGISKSDVPSKNQGSQPQPRAGSDEFANSNNASELLVASLYVPRNDKLVKIDGNLIIQSVLASEKAMASQAVPEMKHKETGLAIPRNFVPASAIPEVGRNGGRHPHSFKNPSDRQKALGFGSSDGLKDNYKSSTGDGTLQQWFYEGLAGPLLSSGKCSEVFRFDVLPASGAIIPASSVANISSQNPENATYHKGRNRRILHSLPVPVARSNPNDTEESLRRNATKDGFQANKSVSSMVVSVLIDPREVGDGDIDDMVAAPKSLTRIFVVVLMDSVKYVTYSCMLPRSGPHLVIT